MSFDDLSMVERFNLAVQSLAGLGTIQERFEGAIFQLLPLRFEDFPSEVAEKFRPVHEGLSRGARGGDLSAEQASKIAKLIVEISHRLTALYEESMAKREIQPFASSEGEGAPPEAAVEPGGPQPQDRARAVEPRCKVFLHTRNPTGDKWTNE